MTEIAPPAPHRSRLKRWPFVLLALLALATAVGALLHAKAEHIVLGAEGYIYGYPLVIMDVTRAHAAATVGPENQLRPVRQFPDASFRGVVRPNVDTLYTSAFIGMAQGPWVFGMAPNDQRYEVMPFMDGLTLLRSPTHMVWLIGRTQTNGAADYPLVRSLQDGLSLRRLADVSAGEQDSPPAPADAPMLVKLARIGIAPGKPPQWSLLDRWSVALGRHIADFKVDLELKKPRGLVRGWSTPSSILGQVGTHYNTRAVVAMVGLGANLPADATYPNARVDAKGVALNGSHRYRLHFKSGELPPVEAGERFLLNARLYWPQDTALDGRWGFRSSSLLTDGSIPRRTSRVERAGAARPPPWAGQALERFRWR